MLDKTFSNIYRHLGFSITFSYRFKENCYNYYNISFQTIFKEKIRCLVEFYFQTLNCSSKSGHFCFLHFLMFCVPFCYFLYWIMFGRVLFLKWVKVYRDWTKTVDFLKWLKKITIKQTPCIINCYESMAIKTKIL